MESTTFRNCRELAGAKPSWCTYNPISVLGSRALKTISFILYNLVCLNYILMS